MVPVHRHRVAIRSDIERQKKVKVYKISVYYVWQNFKLEKLKVRTKDQFICNVYIIIKANLNSLVLRNSIINIILVCPLDQKCGYRNLANHVNIENNITIILL